MFGAVNWGGVITRYNVASQPLEEVDWHYLQRDFGGRNHFILANYQLAQGLHDPHCNYRGYYTDWRGWNYSDWRNRTSIDVRATFPDCSKKHW